jgi:epoxyqueuosine reductase
VAGDPAALAAWIVDVCTRPMPGGGPEGERGGERGGERAVARRETGLGFALAGIARAEPSQRADELRAWLAAGKHGEMAFLADQLAPRLDCRAELHGAVSIIMVADVYAGRAGVDGPTQPDTMWDDVSITPSVGQSSQPTTPAPHAPLGRIARYAQRRDYHQTIKRRLHRLADALRAIDRQAQPPVQTRAFADTAPLMEREHATNAGLGWVGKHTLLIHPRVGSGFVLGGILTTLDLPPTRDQPIADACGTCTRCIDACPTGAITPYSLDARRCISYLTIEHRSLIPDDLAPHVGPWVFGCDICQEVCPHNSPRGLMAMPAPTPSAARPHATLPLLEMLGWTDESRSRLGVSAMKRATTSMLRRNALLGLLALLPTLPTADGQALRTRIESIATDDTEDHLVRATARQVLRLAGGQKAT